MKPTQSTVIHILLGAVVLTTLVLFYMLLAPAGHQGLSPLTWAAFGGGAIVLCLAVFLPSWLRMRAGLPATAPMSRADIGFVIIVTVIGMVITTMGGSMGAMGILFAPMAFLFFRRGRAGVQ